MSEAPILKYKPIQKFVDAVGSDVLKHVGQAKTCVVGLGSDGVFYGEGLYEWLKSHKAQVTYTTMSHDCSDLDESAVSGRKVVLVDNYIITGGAYRRIMGYFQAREKALKIKDITYAVYCDRTNLADFSAEAYTEAAGEEMTHVDSTDFKILKMLAADGRVSLADLASATGLTVSGAKKRVERLLHDGTAEISARINIKRFYALSAVVRIEVDSRSASALVSTLEGLPAVCFLVQVYGAHNVIAGVVAPDLQRVNELVEKYVSSAEGVRHVDVHIGEIPLVPKSKSSW